MQCTRSWNRPHGGKGIQTRQACRDQSVFLRDVVFVMKLCQRFGTIAESPSPALLFPHLISLCPVAREVLEWPYTVGGGGVLPPCPRPK